MKIVIGGQMGKEEIKELAITAMGDEGEVVIKDDVAAAMEVKGGKADLYLGACMTGGGGALAMAIAILGYGTCMTVADADEAAIRKALESGKKAFGFTPSMSKTVVPVIVRLAKEVMCN